MGGHGRQSLTLLSVNAGLAGSWFVITFRDVGGIGGCYGPSDYGRNSKTLQGYARRRYTHYEVEQLAGSQGVHIVLTHDAQAGVCFMATGVALDTSAKPRDLTSYSHVRSHACVSSAIITPALTPKSQG